jgi:peptidoglycan/xylan/chitin deacetylase (PgdA/CDA1 family)
MILGLVIALSTALPALADSLPGRERLEIEAATDSGAIESIPAPPESPVLSGPERAPPGPPHLPAPAQPPPAAAEPLLPVDDGPGSEAILSACWTPEQLAGSPSERKARLGLKPDGTPPPEWAMEAARQAASAAALSLPPVPRGSIRQVEPVDPQARLVALTFDLCERAGERAGYDAGVVDWLRAHRVQATFFAGGQWMRSHPERAMQLMADPLFELGNHAWTHENLRVVQGERARDQILMTQAQYGVLRQGLQRRQCIARAGPGEWERIPVWPRLFRFPYGTCSPETLAAAADLGLASIQWSIVAGDPDKSRSAQAIARAVRAEVRRRRGSIVVAHANGRGWHTAEALPLFVPQLRAEGYRFVTVSDLLAAGQPDAVDACYELRPGDNRRYDKSIGQRTAR